MLKLPKPVFNALLGLWLAALLHVTTPVAMAQADSKEPTDDQQQKIECYLDIEFEHSDNIFHLTDSQQSLMEANASEDSNSGRFENMESVSDDIISPTFGMKYDFKGLDGADLKFSGRVRYNYYNKNREKSYPEAKIRLKNDIGKKGALVLEGNFLFDFYKKNYLSGYDDENDNGNIPRDERIYSSAIYDEYEGSLAYEYELFKNKGNALSQMDIKPFLGFSTRSYNSPFDNRGRNTAFIGVEGTLEFLSKIDLGLVYQYEKTSYPGDNELVLFDEERFESDVNGDGEITGNAPLTTIIDRSADRHTFGINPSFKITKDARLYLGYEKRISYYNSDNPLDLDHYDNTSDRTRFKAGFEYDFSKSWSTGIEYRQTDDEDDEDGDYTENCFALSVRYKLP